MVQRSDNLTTRSLSADPLRAKSSSSQADRIRAEQIDNLYRGAPFGLILEPTVAALLTISLWISTVGDAQGTVAGVDLVYCCLAGRALASLSQQGDNRFRCRPLGASSDADRGGQRLSMGAFPSPCAGGSGAAGPGQGPVCHRGCRGCRYRRHGQLSAGRSASGWG